MEKVLPSWCRDDFTGTLVHAQASSPWWVLRLQCFWQNMNEHLIKNRKCIGRSYTCSIPFQVNLHSSCESHHCLPACFRKINKKPTQNIIQLLLSEYILCYRYSLSFCRDSACMLASKVELSARNDKPVYYGNVQCHISYFVSKNWTKSV